MLHSTERLLYQYLEAYRKLYNRRPAELRVLDEDWVVVNGARMRMTELEYLTNQLQMEYLQVLGQRRSLVSRLINWLKT